MLARAHHCCEAGVRGVCTVRVAHLHHIKRRGQGGGHDAENLLALCYLCHRWVHDHPKEAMENGWLRGG